MQSSTKGYEQTFGDNACNSSHPLGGTRLPKPRSLRLDMIGPILEVQ
jgi:hypothetical protein